MLELRDVGVKQVGRRGRTKRRGNVSMGIAEASEIRLQVNANFVNFLNLAKEQEKIQNDMMVR
jgi:hypothetical protein